MELLYRSIIWNDIENYHKKKRRIWFFDTCFIAKLDYIELA